MALAHSKVTAQGQISVPAEVRRRLGVGPGDVIEWDEEDGRFLVRRAGRYSFADIHRVLFGGRRRPRRKSLAQLEKGIRSYIKNKHARR